MNNNITNHPTGSEPPELAAADHDDYDNDLDELLNDLVAGTCGAAELSRIETQGGAQAMPPENVPTAPEVHPDPVTAAAKADDYAVDRPRPPRLHDSRLEVDPNDSWCDEVLVGILDMLSRNSREDGYGFHRKRIFAISIEMNRIGRMPPSFRPLRSPPRPSEGKVWSNDELMLHQDRVVIDIDWLHQRSGRRRVNDETFSELFDGHWLDIDDAEAFAKKKWSTEIRVDQILALSYVEQIQMASLRSKAIRDQIRNAETSANGPILRRLRDKVEDGRLHRDEIEDYRVLWLARKLAEGRQQRLTGQIFAWMKGEPMLAKSTLSAKLRRLRALTGPSS